MSSQALNKDSEEYKTAYELELWKRAEQSKFKNHLKQMELETIENVTKEWTAKEEKRDAELITKIAKLDTIQKKVQTKAQELQKRENKIIQLEEELKYKINEASRQLGVKEDEIVNVKRRFKEERTRLENDIKAFTDKLEMANNALTETEARQRAYRQDMEESPLSVLRNEIGKKNIEVAELRAQLDKSNEDRGSMEHRFKKLRIEHTKLRRETERQKDEMMDKQAEELEKVKNELKSKALDEQSRQEILLLKDELTKLQTKVLVTEEESKQPIHTFVNTAHVQAYGTMNGQNTVSSNPFASMQGSMMGGKIGKNMNKPDQQQKPTSKLEELTQLRENLVENMNYNDNDDIIIELDDQIRRESRLRSPQKV